MEPKIASQNQNSASTDYTQNQDYLKKVDHEADMKDIRNRLEKIEDRTKDNAAMVTTLADVLTDRNIDPILSKYFNERINLKPAVERAVDSIDKRWLIARLKSIWGFVAAVVLLAIGAVLQKVLG